MMKEEEKGYAQYEDGDSEMAQYEDGDSGDGSGDGSHNEYIMQGKIVVEEMRKRGRGK